MYIDETHTTVVRHSRVCLTTFVRILRLVIKVIHVAYLSPCADRGNFLAMCLRTSEKGWRRVGDGFATYAITWPRFCDNFCRTKTYYMFKTFANSSRCMRSLCDAMRTFGDDFANRFAKQSRTRRIPVR